MPSPRVPTGREVRRLLDRGSGPNHAATARGAADPRLRPRVLPLPPAAAADRVTHAIERRRGWQVVGRGDGVIQATRTTRVFRFVDDISILLEPGPGGTTIAAWSASRVGRYDFGQNRRNLAELWQVLGLRP